MTRPRRPSQRADLVEWKILGGPRDGATLRAPRDAARWSLGPTPPVADPITGRRLYEWYELGAWIGGEVFMKYTGIA